MGEVTENGVTAFLAALDAAVRAIEAPPRTTSPRALLLEALEETISLQAKAAGELGLSESDAACMQAMHDALLRTLALPNPTLSLH